MTWEHLDTQLQDLQQRIESQTQAILLATDLERKEDLMAVRDSMLLRMTQIMEEKTHAQQAEVERIHAELQRTDATNDFRILRR
jgi:shikimate kinase